MFKPLKKPKKIFVKVLKNDTPLTYTQNTNIDSKKTTASNTTLKCDNNEVNNMTEKANCWIGIIWYDKYDTISSFYFININKVININSYIDNL